MPKVPINRIQKIVISKSDEVALVVEKLIDSDARELLLSVPRFSRLADSLANFHLLKREAQLLNKKVIVESVDDKVIELSGLAGLESLNPILSKSRRQFSDIVSSRQTKEEAGEASVRKKKLVESVQKKSERSFSLPSLRFGKKKLLWGVSAVAAFAGLIFLVNSVLPRADIKITTVKIPWDHNDSVKAEKLGSVDPATGTIPAQVFSQKDNLRLSFPASGKKNIEQRAIGKITIYNAYSSDPQPLVASTRFVTPEGKIFRLAKSIVVPGAKIVEGKIIPSTYEASVIADQPGADYNIGPVSYFSIPGFKGTPKYQAFYGESKEPMAGGFVGETSFPTNDDLKKAKAEISKNLESSLREKIASQIPADFKIVDGATNFAVLQQNVIAEAGATGNFSIDADASIVIVAFKEADVLAMLKGKIEKEKGSGYEIKKFDLAYEKARADFANGRISFPVKFNSILSRYIDIASLKEQVKGKSESALKSLIYGLPELQSAVVSLWPFWVSSVPQNEAKINITVD